MPYLKKSLIGAHELAKSIIKSGDTVVDATMGNGNDTLFLAELVGQDGKVYAFDIQQIALEKTRKKLSDAGCLARCRLIFDGHQNMDNHIDEPVKLVVFNLGYLPKGDHSIGTKFETTKAAIEKSLALIADDGMIIVVIYYGGDSGYEEKDKLLQYLATLDCRKYTVLLSEFINQINCPPILIAIEKNNTCY